MKYANTILAFLLAMFELILAMHFLNFPPVPVFSVYIAATAFAASGVTKLRLLTTALCGLSGLALYGYNIYQAVVHYPAFGNWLGIAFDGFTAFLIFGALVVNLPSLSSERR